MTRMEKMHKLVPPRTTHYTVYRHESERFTLNLYDAKKEVLPGDAQPVDKLIKHLGIGIVKQEIRDARAAQVERAKDAKYNAQACPIDPPGFRTVWPKNPSTWISAPEVPLTDTGLPKQERYKSDNGKDFIDESYETMTWEEFVGAMKFTIGKYMKRFGKKDDIESESKKVMDYAIRLHQKVLDHKKRIRTKV